MHLPADVLPDDVGGAIAFEVVHAAQHPVVADRRREDVDPALPLPGPQRWRHLRNDSS